MGWFNNLTISVKLAIGFLILCVLMLCVGGMGINGLNIMKANVNSLYYDAYVGASAIKDINATLENVRLLTLEVILPENRPEISSLESEIQNKVANTNKMLKAYEDALNSQEDRANFEELKKILTTYREKRQIVVDSAKRGDYASAAYQYKNQFVPASLAVGNQAVKMSVWNDKQGLEYIKKAETSFGSAMTEMSTSIVAGLILAIALSFFITRSIVTPLMDLVKVSSDVASGNLAHNIEVVHKGPLGLLQNSIKIMVNNLRDIIGNVQASADNMAASSEELTASADQSSQAANNVATSIMNVAQGAERQLAIAGETVNTAEKMSAEAEQISANADIVAASSDKTAQSAQTGRKAAATAVNQMASIQGTVENLAQEITGLGMRSKEIGQIVETISSISSQTNLLALNAAIEAARAGEQGRGFAVVAEEVRKLAEQSQDAAKQIASLIGGIQDDTNKAVQAMESGTREVKVGADLVNTAGAAFEEIASLIGQTTVEVKEISEAIRQMAIDSQAIVAGAQEVNIVSQETSGQTQSVSAATEEQLASMQEIASASQSLAKRAEELQTLTKRFVM